MKSWICLMLSLALLIGCLPGCAFAQEEWVYCEQQDFSTKYDTAYTTEWEEGNGQRIWLDGPGYVPNVLIWRRSDDAKFNNPVNYLNNVYREYMENRYDNNVATNPCQTVVMGGKTVYMARYHYVANGNKLCMTRVIEIRDDGDVEYAAKYAESDPDEGMAALEMAVQYYQTGKPASAAAKTAPTLAAFNVKPAAPILSGISVYQDGRFRMQLPNGWQVMTQSEYMSFCFKAWDPASPNRSFFLFMKLEPLLKSWEAQAAYKQVDDSLGGNSLYALSAYAPVMESCTLKGFLDAIPQIKAYCRRFYSAGLTISPDVIPDMNQVEIVEKKPSSLPAPDTCKENVIERITYQDSQGQLCEGLVTAQPTDSFSYDFFGVDGWPYTVYVFMGVTAPVGEMQELEPSLTECLGSFGFEESYVSKAIDISTQETQQLLQQGREMQAAHDAMVQAWYDREKSYDITYQKISDGILGYDRLYDSSTGEVYRADVGFYDSYDLNRSAYSNPNLQRIDTGSQQYYLQGVDYYITQ